MFSFGGERMLRLCFISYWHNREEYSAEIQTQAEEGSSFVLNSVSASTIASLAEELKNWAKKHPGPLLIVYRLPVDATTKDVDLLENCVTCVSPNHRPLELKEITEFRKAFHEAPKK